MYWCSHVLAIKMAPMLFVCGVAGVFLYRCGVVRVQSWDVLKHVAGEGAGIYRI